MRTVTASIRSELPPGPKGTIIGGNVRQFRVGLLDFLLNTARDYGPLASFRVGPRRVFLASGPDLIEQVLVTDAKHYIKHFGARAFRPVLGNGLVTSEGVFWRRQRKRVQPTFLKNRVASYAPIMTEQTEQMLASWTYGKSVQIDYEFEALTSKIALKTAFNLDDPGDGEQFSETLKLAFDLLNERLCFWFLADSIQQIHSFRASDVMSSHVSNALASEVSAFFRSAGRSWTTPPEISFRLKVSLTSVSPVAF